MARVRAGGCIGLERPLQEVDKSIWSVGPESERAERAERAKTGNCFGAKQRLLFSVDSLFEIHFPEVTVFLDKCEPLFASSVFTKSKFYSHTLLSRNKLRARRKEPGEWTYGTWSKCILQMIILSDSFICVSVTESMFELILLQFLLDLIVLGPFHLQQVNGL